MGFKWGADTQQVVAAPMLVVLSPALVIAAPLSTVRMEIQRSVDCQHSLR